MNRDNGGVFLKRQRRHVRGEIYEYWTLAKTVRTARGPRHGVVSRLGKLDDATALAQAIAGTIRVQLLKIAAHVTVSVRRVHVSWRVRSHGRTFLPKRKRTCWPGPTRAERLSDLAHDGAGQNVAGGACAFFGKKHRRTAAKRAAPQKKTPPPRFATICTAEIPDPLRKC